MNNRGFSDEMLMAFADGELDEVTAASVERAANADPEIAARVAAFMETRRVVASAVKPLADEPVPAALEASLRRAIAAAKAAEGAVGAPAGKVVALRPRPARSRSFARFALPLAASIAVAIAGAAGYLAGSGMAPHEAGLSVAGLESPALAGALESVGSGEEVAVGGDRFRAIATFRDDAGALCREFEVDRADGSSTLISVACRRDAGWAVRFAVAAPGAEGGYAPASSTESLDAYLTSIGAGQPIGQEEERQALAALAGPR